MWHLRISNYWGDPGEPHTYVKYSERVCIYIYIYRTSCHVFLFDATKMASVGNSFSACLSSRAAKPDVQFHRNHTHTHTHTPCAVTCLAMEMHKDVLKSQGFIVMHTELPCPTCECTCVPAMLLQHLFSLHVSSSRLYSLCIAFGIVRSCLYCLHFAPVIPYAL